MTRNTQKREMRKIVKMKITGLFLLALLPLLAVSITYATKPTASTNGHFTITGSKIIGSPRMANDNTIATFNRNFSLTGPLNGKVVAIERDVIHSATGTVKLTFQGRGTFTGTVQDKSGTLIINYVATGSSTTFSGQFTILSGTDGLSNLRGQGTFQGNATGGTYTIRWHFDTAK